MKLSYCDVLGDKKRHMVGAEIVPVESGEPVIILHPINDTDIPSDVLNVANWCVLQYQVEESTSEELGLLMGIFMVNHLPGGKTVSEIGRLGGLSKSEAKRKAAVINGRKGGRPKKVQSE